MQKKVLVLGHGRHGKDTVAEILNADFGYRLISSSWFAASRVMMPYFESIGKPYDTVEECYEDRHTGNNRVVWFDQISAYNTPDKAKLPREILEVADIYVGMRAADEYQASKDLFDYVVWVDASARGIPEEGRGSFDIDFDPETMILIQNDGTLEDLHQKVRCLADYMADDGA